MNGLRISFIWKLQTEICGDNFFFWVQRIESEIRMHSAGIQTQIKKKIFLGIAKNKVIQ